MSATPAHVHRAMTRRRRALLIAPVALAMAGTVVFTAGRASADTPFARANLVDANGAYVGRVEFFDEYHHTTVRARLKANANVTPETFHGFHVHAGVDAASGASGCVADPTAPSSTWYVSAGGHYKADGQVHSGHLGDLPSLHVNGDGSASATFTTDRFVPGDLEGKAIVLHAGPDNFGNVPVGTAPEQYTPNSPAAVTRTQNTGNAGDRVACGVISLRRRH